MVRFPQRTQVRHCHRFPPAHFSGGRIDSRADIGERSDAEYRTTWRRTGRTAEV
jgi:hypothetical protein